MLFNQICSLTQVDQTLHILTLTLSYVIHEDNINKNPHQASRLNLFFSSKGNY